MTQFALPAKATSSAVAAQPWLSSPRWDCLFIIGPAFLSAAVVLAFRPWFESLSNFPVWAWVSLVLLVDVAHVYATLFRTYFNKEAFAHNRTLLLTIPLVCWVGGALLYSIDALWFWRTLAYLAVFHFIRQQYGFVAMYSRSDPAGLRQFARLDELTVYSATIYPLLYWHTHLPRAFSWFVDGDFAAVPATFCDFVSGAGLVVYAVILLAYVIKEMALYRTTNFVNVPRNLLIAGTALSWWVGIISLNSDFAFTMTNVLAHGIPYMALVWLYHRDTARQDARKEDTDTQKTDAAQTDTSNTDRVSPRRMLLAYLPLFLVFLAFLAYVEEGLWDGFIWREHLQVFPMFSALPHLKDGALLALLVPLLALPQSTHYVLDGFIWRIKDLNSSWSIWQSKS